MEQDPSLRRSADFFTNFIRAPADICAQDVKEFTVVAGNPAKFIRRITSGPTVDDHHNSDIQEQNHRMLKEMRDDAQNMDR